MENISYQNTKNYDLISELPVDKKEPSTTELQIVNTLFTKHKKAMSSIFSEAKESLIVGVLFVIFTVPFVDSLLKKVLPITERSPWVLLLIKILFVMILFWIIKHWHFSKF